MWIWVDSGNMKQEWIKGHLLNSQSLPRMRSILVELCSGVLWYSHLYLSIISAVAKELHLPFGFVFFQTFLHQQSIRNIARIWFIKCDWEWKMPFPIRGEESKELLEGRGLSWKENTKAFLAKGTMGGLKLHYLGNWVLGAVCPFIPQSDWCFSRIYAAQIGMNS